MKALSDLHSLINGVPGAPKPTVWSLSRVITDVCHAGRTSPHNLF